MLGYAHHLLLRIVNLVGVSRWQSYSIGGEGAYALHIASYNSSCVGLSPEIDHHLTYTPRMLSAEDAQKLSIPLAIYISNDEPLDEVIETLATFSIILNQICVV